MENTAHLIEYLQLADGTRVYVYDYCKDDKEFEKKLNAYQRRYNVYFVRVNHNTDRKGNTARTRKGEYKETKKNHAHMTMSNYTYDPQTGKKESRQYFFSDRDIADYIFWYFEPWGATLDGTTVTIPFAIGCGTYFVRRVFDEIKWAF